MSEPLVTFVSVLLVTLGVAAELNLLRIFVCEWRKGRGEERSLSFRTSPPAREVPQPARRGALTRRATAASFVAPALVAGVALGQSESQPAAPTPSDETPRRALPSPWSSPPFPSSEYLGPTIGVPNSTPDYAFMNTVKDTAFGRWQRGSRIDIYGWVNGSWNWSTSKDSNLPNTYDLVPNQVNLNQLVLRAERNPDTVQTGSDDWGFRATALYGTDYRFTVAKGWFDHQLLDNNDLYGFDMPELYALWYTPKVAEGMVLKVGRYISPPDIEAQLAPDNYLFSHSEMFSIDPYTFTGVTAMIKLDDHWSIQPGIHAGNDMAPWSDSAALNGQFLVRWVSQDNNDSIWAGINSLGTGKYRNEHDNLQQVVGTWTHRFNEKVHTATEVYFMWQYDALKGGSVSNGPVRSFGGGGGPGPLIPGLSDSLGFVNYTQFQVSDRDYISVRNDVLCDFQGQRTGFENTYYTFTIGWSRNLSPCTTIRPEIKYEHAFDNPAYDLGTKKDQLRFGVDLIVRF
jgi:hypothetical protein